MRKATIVTVLVGILVFTMQCSKIESLDNLNGRTELTSAPIDNTSYFITPDGLLDSVIVHIDSIRWVYEFPTAGSSSLSIVMSGKISGMNYDVSLDSIINRQTDLEVETYTASVPGMVSVTHDSVGVFIDTVLIDTFYHPGASIPPQPENSRLFVRNISQRFDIDTIKVADTLNLSDTILVFDTLQVRDTIQELDTLPLVNPW
jgi:hypothetical protein